MSPESAQPAPERAPSGWAGQAGSMGGMLLQMQHTLGNHRVQRMMEARGGTAPTPIIQTKLVLGPTDDPYEREADRVAQQATGPATSHSRGATPLTSAAIGRMSTLAGAGGAVDAGVQQGIQSARGGGHSLPDAVRTQMEQSLRADFSGVRIHTGARADQLNQTLQARAFTTGQDIFFRRGEYNPSGQSGQQILAHELTHVVQQGGGSTPQSIQRLMSANKFKQKTKLPGRTGKSDQHFRAMKHGLRAYQQSNDFADLAPVYDRAQGWLNSPAAATSSRRKYVRRLIRQLEQEIGFSQELEQEMTNAFVIIDPAAVPTQPNELTPNEFAQVASLLFRIFAGLSKLRISPQVVDIDSPPGIEDSLKIETMKDVIKLAQTETGRDLLGTIAYAADDIQPVGIEPYDLVVDPTAKPKIKDKPGAQSAIVSYTPGEYKTSKASNSAGNMAQMRETAQHNPWVTPERSDISLYHELVHAFHIQSGKAKSQTQFVGSDASNILPVDEIDAPRTITDGFGNKTLTGVSEEEYYTVGLGKYADKRFTENRYRRERRALGENVPHRGYYANKSAELAKPKKGKKKKTGKPKNKLIL